MAEQKRIMARTGKDAHNVVFTKEALESAAEAMNGDRAVRIGANHDPFCMPYGKIVEASVEPIENGHVLVASMYIEDNSTQLTREETGEQLVLLDFGNNPKPFKKLSLNESLDQTEVRVDFVNFDSKQKYFRFLDGVKNIDDGFSCGGGIGRKSLIPEPFIQFVLSHTDAAIIASVVGWWMIVRAKRFIDHTIDETLKKVGDDLSDKLSAKIISVYEMYKKNQAQDERPVLTQIIVPGDVELNLLTRTEHDAKHQGMELGILRAEIEKYNDLLQLAESVTFGREGARNWKFLYMTTKAGEVIGTLECFDRTRRVLKEVSTRFDSDEDDNIEE